MFFNGSDYGDGEVAEEEYPVAEPHKPYDLKSEGSGDGESHGGSGGRYRRGDRDHRKWGTSPVPRGRSGASDPVAPKPPTLPAEEPKVEGEVSEVYGIQFQEQKGGTIKVIGIRKPVIDGLRNLEIGQKLPQREYGFNEVNKDEDLIYYFNKVFQHNEIKNEESLKEFLGGEKGVESCKEAVRSYDFCETIKKIKEKDEFHSYIKEFAGTLRAKMFYFEDMSDVITSINKIEDSFEEWRALLKKNELGEEDALIPIAYVAVAGMPEAALAGAEIAFIMMPGALITLSAAVFIGGTVYLINEYLTAEEVENKSKEDVKETLQSITNKLEGKDNSGEIDPALAYGAKTARLQGLTDGLRGASVGDEGVPPEVDRAPENDVGSRF